MLIHICVITLRDPPFYLFLRLGSSLAFEGRRCFLNSESLEHNLNWMILPMSIQRMKGRLRNVCGL